MFLINKDYRNIKKDRNKIVPQLQLFHNYTYYVADTVCEGYTGKEINSDNLVS